MRITRLYFSDNLTCGEITTLDANSSNHLIRVLRTKKDTEIILFNGDGYDYLCTTEDENPKKTTVAIKSKVKNNSESNISITLIQGLSRQDRMETTIQKAIELGVNKIIPLLSQRSNTRLNSDKQIKKIDHWRKIGISACEQSGRSYIPELTEILSLNDVIHVLDNKASKFLLNPDARTSFKDIGFKHQNIEILIGPEGGLNDEEIQLLEKNNFKSICFGPRVLRTETAGPAVISAIQILWGDL